MRSKTEGILSRETQYILKNNKLYVHRIIYSSKTIAETLRLRALFPIAEAYFPFRIAGRQIPTR